MVEPWRTIAANSEIAACAHCKLGFSGTRSVSGQVRKAFPQHGGPPKSPAIREKQTKTSNNPHELGSCAPFNLIPVTRVRHSTQNKPILLFRLTFGHLQVYAKIAAHYSFRLSLRLPQHSNC